MHGTWTSAADDAANLAWLRGGMDRLTPVTTGSYVGHADLARPGRMDDCHSIKARDRIAELARTYDPTGIFAGRQVRDATAIDTTALAAE
jgi:hypothetical protein